MDREEWRLALRRELGYLLERVDYPWVRGVVVLGEPGTGKTRLLDMVGESLAARGRPVFRVRPADMRYSGDLGTAVVQSVAASRYMSAIAEAERTFRSSSPVSQSESVSILHLAELKLDRPVLLLDAVDEAPFPERIVSAIAELSTRLSGWQIVVSSRPVISFGRLRGFDVITLGGSHPAPGSALPAPFAPPAAPAPAEQGDSLTSVPFRIRDLTFGAEEAERDELLDSSYVPVPGAADILGGGRTIVVGDRGSGKSAIFRRLQEDTTPGTRVLPVTNAGDLLRKIVPDTAWLDTDRLRAAWLVIVAATVATVLPDSAPKLLRHDAAALRAALGFPIDPGAKATRALRAVFRALGGTTLRFTVGPCEMDVQLPSGTAAPSGKSPVDVGEFLHAADRFFGQSGSQPVVMLDRIDETLKYDRITQQAIVQALFLAEAHVSLLGDVGLIVFLRTDLFELYDIQEKNKLVSRTITLDWEEEGWLRMLVRRALANEPLRELGRQLGVADEAADVRAALDVLFPPEIEGQPADRWLIDSLRNGNGNISPRSAVLLLFLARERAAKPDAVVSKLPLFSAVEAGEAMTRLSNLSFDEVVNDFKVAPSFVQNCRAGKLERFNLADVRELFDETEGRVSDQVRLLERLGFLERIVRERRSAGGDIVRESMFRIPRLYTRCWNYG